MIFRWFKKIKNSISLLIVFCVTVPLLAACGESENNLKTSIKNQIIGVGGSIEAYTTYSQAKFLEMDEDMYHSYLVSGRDFILVALPRGIGESDSGYPNKNNLMFQAVYNGVTPYAEEIINGNFMFKTPEYKLLIYYVLADEFLSWEKKANEESDEGFIGKALDFLGPSDADNYDTNFSLHSGFTKDLNVVRNKEEYNLKNVVNRNSFVSECDFLRVDENYNIAAYTDAKDTLALGKCGSDDNVHPIGKNVVADVARGASKGVTLLFGGGGLTGYFTYDQVQQYDFNNAGWITKLLEEYSGSTEGDKMESYITEILRTTLCAGENSGSELCTPAEIHNYAERMRFKFQYDLALLGRISRINYNTLLDINTSGINTTSLTKDSKDAHIQKLKGTTDVNGGTYITFTTAKGFTIDRGNIIMEAGEDLLFNTDFLEILTQMDACTNRTLASYVAEVLATVGIVVGGIAVGVGAAILVGSALAYGAAAVTSLATVGAVSMSVPGIGWIIGGICLLAAGAAALYYGTTTKKAINDTNSANFCEEYEKAIKDIIEMSQIKLPIYHYEIPRDPKGRTTELCYADYVEVDGVMQCGSKDENGNFKKSTTIPAFYMADLDIVDQMGDLSGAPSVRLYSEGKLVDEFYGAASPQFVYSILDSWGVTAASNMKFYTSVNKNESNDITSVSIYDLLYTDAERNTYISKASYCASVEYGEGCEDDGVPLSIGYTSFNKGVYTINDLSGLNSSVESMLNSQAEDLKSQHRITNINEYKDRIKKIAKYVDMPVTTDGNGVSKVTIDGVEYTITKGPSYKLQPSSGLPIITGGEFILDELSFYIREGDPENGEGKYVVRLISDRDWIPEDFNKVIKELGELFNNNAGEELSKFSEQFKQKFVDEKSKDAVIALADQLGTNEYLGGVTYYTQEVPVYFTATIVEKDGSGNENETAASTVYKKGLVELVYEEVVQNEN